MDCTNKFFNILYYFFKFFGSATMSYEIINRGRQRNSDLVNLSKIGQLQNILFSILFISLTIIYDGYIDRNSVDVSKTMKYIHVNFILSSFAIGFTILRPSFKQKEVLSIMKKFIIISQNLILDQLIRKKFYIVTFAVIIQSFRTISLVWRLLSRQALISSIGFLIFLDLYLDCVINSVLLELSFLLQLIENCIQCVNNDMIDERRFNFFSCDTRSLKNWSLRLKVKKYSDFYRYISNLSQELSDYYSLPVLLLITVVFMITLTFLYMFLQVLMVADSFNESYLLKILILIYPLFWLTVRVTALIKEVCLFVYKLLK